jgi:hypothetical protein
MNGLSVAVFIVTGLVLTAYFGTTAGRLSAVGNANILGNIPPAFQTGWNTTGTRR